MNIQHPEAVLEVICSRRSCRRFTQEKVPRGLLEQIIAAGQKAPVALGKNPPSLLVVEDEHLIARLSEVNREVLRVKSDPFFGAKTVLIVLADREKPSYDRDASAMLENMMLAAHALGLGSCWIHRAKEEMESPVGLELRSRFCIPEQMEGIGHCILGYPAKEPGRQPPMEWKTYYA